jgi:flagellar basal-body rod protein FlgG
MMAVEDRQAVIANNIANSTTPGFKRQVAVQKGFDLVFESTRIGAARFKDVIAPGGGLKVSETFSGLENGIISNTGNALDVALIGPGYFKVNAGNETMYTRAGRFSVGESGLLVTQHGYPVLDANDEPIDITNGIVTFDATGNVIVNDVPVAELGIVDFADPHALSREGYSLYRNSGLTTIIPAENTTVAPQSLEASNVQLPIEMTNMMMALRAYAANQQVISSVSETTSRLIDQVGGQ